METATGSATPSSRTENLRPPPPPAAALAALAFLLGRLHHDHLREEHAGLRPPSPRVAASISIS